MMNWSKLRLIDGENYELQGDARTAKLQEFRQTGGMMDVFFAPIGAPHENPDDASTHGPASPADVDWTGFPG